MAAEMGIFDKPRTPRIQLQIGGYQTAIVAGGPFYDIVPVFIWVVFWE
jgi:hypothetical protein